MEAGRVQTEVEKIATLDFAHGKVGERHPLVDVAAEAQFAQGLGEHTVQLTKTNTADCGDERRTIRLADGTEDVDALQARIVPQLLGGIGLSTTKALLAANSPIVKDTKDMWTAYERVSKLLAELGEEDAGHQGCGASANAESSVAKAIDHDILVPSIGLFVPQAQEMESLITQNTESKQRRLQDGFYGAWDPKKHVDYLTQRYPQNFSYLAEDPNDYETRGHNGSGVYVVTGEGVGFAKNKFIEDTGKESFAVTAAKMVELAHRLGGSEEERARILLGYVDDTLHVSGGIVTRGMPVFAESN